MNIPGFDNGSAAPKFIATFARFEFALVAAGYVGGKITENAWADWDAFASDLPAGMFEEITNNAALAEILAEPPRKLIRISETSCEFQEMPAPTGMVGLLIAIRRIRNNLFHGSKTFYRPRDERLVEGGLHTLVSILCSRQLSGKAQRVPIAFTFSDLGES